MDAVTGRDMTTVGILWSVSPVSPTAPTIVLDVEGTDARARVDANFERKLATFALAISDHIMINLWCHDIGRRQATGRELMKITFQVRLGWAFHCLPLAPVLQQAALELWCAANLEKVVGRPELHRVG